MTSPVTRRGLIAALLAGATTTPDHTKPTKMSNSWSNNAVRSITLPNGATTGARIVIDGDTDAIYEYDAANHLTGVWAASAGTDPVHGIAYRAGFTEIDPATNRIINMSQAEVLFQDPVFTSPGFLTAHRVDSLGHVIQANAELFSGEVGGQGAADISMFSTSADGTTLPAGIWLTQDDAVASPIVGQALQNDSGLNDATHPKFLHMDVYSVAFTTGVGSFFHNAVFTPKGAILTSTGSGNPLITQVTYSRPIGVAAITVQAYDRTGTPYTGGGQISAIFFG